MMINLQLTRLAETAATTTEAKAFSVLTIYGCLLFCYSLGSQAMTGSYKHLPDITVGDYRVPLPKGKNSHWA
jgi:hypothetical protein